MPNPPGTSSFQAKFNDMTDSQLKQTISQLSSAAQSTYGTYRSPAGTASYLDPKAWTNSLPGRASSTAPPRRSTRSTTRPSGSATPVASAATQQSANTPVAVPPMAAMFPPSTMMAAQPYAAAAASNPARAPLQSKQQAMQTTYFSRLRTGTTLLMQPILTATAAAATTGRIGTRRGGIVNYAEPGSGDELDGGVESDDSDFVASGGTRTAIRASRGNRPSAIQGFHSSNSLRPGTPLTQQKAELDQSYLGMIPPAKFVTAKRAEATKHDYPTEEALEYQATRGVALVPIRVEFETDTHRIRDCFVWNLYENLVKPDLFARVFCADLDIPANPWAETVANQIRAQLEEHEGIVSMDLGGIDIMNPDSHSEIPECRVLLSIDVQIATHHLVDHIEWDLLSPLTPEVFAQQLCMDMGLSGESAPLIAHAIHEEIIKHKKDAVEWGVIGGDRELLEESLHDNKPRDKSGLSLMKDKTGLGLGGWGRTPRDGRGPKTLRSVWKDWSDADEYATRFDVLTAEEVERREIERERASRRLRRETSKFQYQGVSRRRR